MHGNDVFLQVLSCLFFVFTLETAVAAVFHEPMEHVVWCSVEEFAKKQEAVRQVKTKFLCAAVVAGLPFDGGLWQFAGEPGGVFCNAHSSEW